MKKNKTLLIEWVFYSATGHAIEAYKIANAIRRCNPDMEIWVLLNAQCPGVQLAQCLPTIDKVVPIDIWQPGESVRQLPREWDYILLSSRSLHPIEIGGISQFRMELSLWVSARIAKGICCPEGTLIEGDNLPSFESASLHLNLPAHARSLARDFVRENGSPRISVLLGSASEGRTPPLAFWRRLFQGLVTEYPNIEIVLLGCLANDTSVTLGTTQQDLDQLTTEFPNIHNAFDIGLINHLAIAELCDCHLSPHTGMGIVIQCVGVPWVILEGGLWHVPVLNGVPFWAIYPDCEQFPCGVIPSGNDSRRVRSMLTECRESMAHGKPFFCMSDTALKVRLPEILQGVRFLLENKIPYTDAITRHHDELLCRCELTSAEAAERLLMEWPAVMTKDYVFGKESL